MDQIYRMRMSRSSTDLRMSTEFSSRNNPGHASQFIQVLDESMCVVREDLTEWLQRYLFSSAEAPPIDPQYLLHRLSSGLWLSRLAYKLHSSVLNQGSKPKPTNIDGSGDSYEFLRGAVSNRDLNNISSKSLPPFPRTLSTCAQMPLGHNDLRSNFSDDYSTTSSNVATSGPTANLQSNNPLHSTNRNGYSSASQVANHWIARDNISSFIRWCKDLGIPETVLFETTGLVHRTEEKNVLLTLMELARIASRYGLTDLPYLVRMEREIDEIEARCAAAAVVNTNTDQLPNLQDQNHCSSLTITKIQLDKSKHQDDQPQEDDGFDKNNQFDSIAYTTIYNMTIAGQQVNTPNDQQDQFTSTDHNQSLHAETDDKYEVVLDVLNREGNQNIDDDSNDINHDDSSNNNNISDNNNNINNNDNDNNNGDCNYNNGNDINTMGTTENDLAVTADEETQPTPQRQVCNIIHVRPSPRKNNASSNTNENSIHIIEVSNSTQTYRKNSVTIINETSFAHTNWNDSIQIINEHNGTQTDLSNKDKRTGSIGCPVFIDTSNFGRDKRTNHQQSNDDQSPNDNHSQTNDSDSYVHQESSGFESWFEVPSLLRTRITLRKRRYTGTKKDSPLVHLSPPDFSSYNTPCKLSKVDNGNFGDTTLLSPLDFGLSRQDTTPKTDNKLKTPNTCIRALQIGSPEPEPVLTSSMDLDVSKTENLDKTDAKKVSVDQLSPLTFSLSSQPEITTTECDLTHPGNRFLLTDEMIVEHQVRKKLALCTCCNRLHMQQLEEGRYKLGSKVYYLRRFRNHVMVRVGGGWMTLDDFLNHHDPCRRGKHCSISEMKTSSYARSYKSSLVSEESLKVYESSPKVLHSLVPGLEEGRSVTNLQRRWSKHSSSSTDSHSSIPSSLPPREVSDTKPIRPVNKQPVTLNVNPTKAPAPRKLTTPRGPKLLTATRSRESSLTRSVERTQHIRSHSVGRPSQNIVRR